MKIKFFPLQAHCFAFGGFEIQMLSAFDAILKHAPNDVNISKIDVWSRSFDFDIAHFWGLEIDNYNNLKWAKRSGKKVVITALLGYYENYISKIKNFGSKYIAAGRFRIEMLNDVDALVVISEEQKIIAQKYFNVSKEKIWVIPNMVSSEFLKNVSLSVADHELPFKDYVLCAGNICKRKNQYALLKAAQLLGINFVLAGNSIAGEETYSKLVETIINSTDQFVWLKGLKENSTELVNLMKNSKAFALPSFAETQPISLLEAAFCGRPLLTSNLAFAKQKYYKNAYLVNPSSVSDIANGLKNILSNPELYILPEDNLLSCTSEAVGKAYIDLYHSL
jgi:glycosyltransferase involved in cell wall biosynthesis